MMLGRARQAACAVAAMALAGCASSHVLVHTQTTSVTAPSTTTATSTTATGPSRSEYVARLRAEEQNLAAAERRIPTNAPTPRALARSTLLLAAAVSRLASGLASIEPPPVVASAHARLVAIARAYAGRLRAVAGLARQPGGQVRASRQLVSATNRASAAFGATLSKIYSTLGVRQP